MSQLRKRTLGWCVTVAVLAAMAAREVGGQTHTPASDTVPEFAFAIDPAAIAARLRPLRMASPSAGEREVRVWSGFGIAVPHTLYQLRTSGGAIRGAVILWWRHSGEWAPADNPESMHEYVTRVFACGEIRRHERTDACEVDPGRHQADWGRILERIDNLGVRTLQTPAANPIVLDGHHMVVETREGTAYRTAYFAVPSPAGPGDTPRAAAILGVLDRIRDAVVRDSTPRRR
jgi:hypothetical protein